MIRGLGHGRESYGVGYGSYGFTIKPKGASSVHSWESQALGVVVVAPDQGDGDKYNRSSEGDWESERLGTRSS